MADIFISYSSQTHEQTENIAAALVDEGFDVWWDRKLQAHRNYGEEIEEQLGGAKAVLVVWSQEAARSQWVRSEADRARQAGKLIQAAIDDAILPMPFDQMQCVRMGHWTGDRNDPAWRSICASAAALNGRSSQPLSEIATQAARPRPSAERTDLTMPLLVVLLPALPVVGWLAGFAPPEGNVQTVILAFMVAAFFLVALLIAKTLARKTLIPLAVIATLATFGSAIGYNLISQRFVFEDAARDRMVLGCGWREDAQKQIRQAVGGKLAPSQDTESQCPGDYPLIRAGFGLEPERLYSADNLDLVWLIISMAWGATFMFLPLLAAFALELARRPAARA